MAPVVSLWGAKTSRSGNTVNDCWQSEAWRPKLEQPRAGSVKSTRFGNRLTLQQARHQHYRLTLCQHAADTIMWHDWAQITRGVAASSCYADTQASA